MIDDPSPEAIAWLSQMAIRAAEVQREEEEEIASRASAFQAGAFQASGFGNAAFVGATAAATMPEGGLLLQAVIVPGEQTSEGQIVLAAAVPWFKIVEMLQRDPNLMYQIHWRQWEDIIAAAYSELGFEVVLTPRSADGGRDVIASSRGFGSIRYFDQVKAYGPGRKVTANDVRAMLGVLVAEPNVSKGVVTTTSEFAPGIEADENLKRFMPFQLELKARQALLKWLGNIARGIKMKSPAAP
jgi:restriction system protein